ncbi:MAG: tRNA pseudouridine(38-40) synthase TruA [Bacteroidota bacterium]
MKGKYFYLIHVQYLGFRFHGWAKQPGIKTVHHMIDRTLKYVLGKETPFKTLGSSRTDAMVSANHSVFELFVNDPLELDSFMVDVNANLPADIRVLEIETIDETFNVIQSPKVKEYQYLFTYGEKPHPFCASIVACFPWKLDIERMKEGAEVFQGSHNFQKYCTKPNENTVFNRTIDSSYIAENELYSASFFPEKSFIFFISGKGFMRHQIRLMMGQLVQLGRGNISLDQLKASIQNPDEKPLETIAPASGLILNRINFD